jgi:hypothetical protein
MRAFSHIEPGVATSPGPGGLAAGFEPGRRVNHYLRAKEVIGMRCLLVLDMDLLAMDEEHDLEPINYLVARREHESCEVVVLSLTEASRLKLPSWELLLGAKAGKFPVAPKPDHDLSAAAGHRMELAVRHLETIGCQASGLISDEELVKAVRSETAHQDYDEVILATGRHEGSGLARLMGRDPVHRLRRKWGERLIVFPEGHRQEM